MLRVFIQARMSSSRFPGKVLAPFRGQPMIKQVITRIANVVSREQIVVLSSIQPTDDPLAAYVDSLGISVYRGPLENVFRRFQLCLGAYPCDWVARISGDSPLMQDNVLRQVLAQVEDNDVDLITNVFPRTYPRGCSVEIINTATLSALKSDALIAEEQEHVTKVFYNHPDRYQIVNVASRNPALAKVDLTVDSLDDLARLENFDENTIEWE